MLMKVFLSNVSLSLVPELLPWVMIPIKCSVNLGINSETLPETLVALEGMLIRDRLNGGGSETDGQLIADCRV